MNKRTLLVLSILAVAILLMAACAPATSTPATSAALTATPATIIPTTVASAEAQASPTTEAAGTATPDTRPTVPAPDGSRALAKLTAQERVERFSGPAATYAKPNTIYVATIVTDKGNIVAELYRDTPESLNNFVTLALNGFYDGLTFHRVEEGFVIQGGDPAGDGSGGPGYTIPAEINHQHLQGALAWARTGDQVNPEQRSSGSQFYITLDEQPYLDSIGYTVFGQVIEGMDVVKQIAIGDKITEITIAEATASRMPTPEPTPTPNPPVASEGRPLAQIPIEKREALYNAPPALTIDTTKSYQAIIEIAGGKIVVDLDVKTAPQTVNNFVMLAELGYFDEMPIAAVLTDTTSMTGSPTMLISGSPAKLPSSDVGYHLATETTATASTIVTGTIGMYPVTDPATGNPVASGSTFFISFIAESETTVPLNLFGTVSEGLDLARGLTENDVIKTITIKVK